MKTSLLATTLFVCLTTTSCTIGKCNLEDQTYFIADEERLVYNQGDELMFVSNHLDTLYFEVSIEHGFDTNNPDKSGYCTHVVWEFEYFNYILKNLPNKSSSRILIDSTYLSIYASTEPYKVAIGWPSFITPGNVYFNYVFAKEDNLYVLENFQTQIKEKKLLTTAYYFPDNNVNGYSALLHDRFGLLGMIVDVDTFILVGSPFYDQLLQQEIIKKQ